MLWGAQDSTAMTITAKEFNFREHTVGIVVHGHHELLKPSRLQCKTYYTWQTREVKTESKSWA